jgi:CRISPR system Cascade subunit CasA
MTFSFNLIDEPWIPCVDHQGQLVEVGLHDLLLQAQHLQAICCETPLMTAAMMPVVLALLHRVFGPEGSDEWEVLWEMGQFPSEPLEVYFERWQDRFDLFHPEYPFYQVRDRRLEPKSTLYLAASIANTYTLFNHVVEETAPPLTPTQAALTLLTAQFFRLGGGVTSKQTPNLIDGSLAKGVLFFAYGNNLFETLTLNLVRYPDDLILSHTPDDKPIWEHDDPFRQRAVGKQILNLTPKGYLDYLTWQTFHIEFFPEVDVHGDVVVPSATVVPVARLTRDVFSPQKRYIRKAQDKDWKLLRFNREKAIWRDYHSLLSLSNKNAKPPAVIEWLSDLAEYGILAAGYNLQLTSIGMLADQAEPIFYRQEQMPLPVAVLQNPTFITSISQAIKHAEDVAIELRLAAMTLARYIVTHGKGDKLTPKDTRSKVQGNLVRQWGVISIFWMNLEPIFWDYIASLEDDSTDSNQVWCDVLIQQAREGLAAIAYSSGNNAAALKGQINAERQLNARLKKLFNG